MKIKEKLAFFQQAVIEEAEDKRNSILTEIDETFIKSCKEITAMAQREANDKIHSEMYLAEQMKNKDTIQALQEAKKSLLDLRSQLKDEVFERVRKRIHDFTLSDEYVNFLRTEIKKVVDSYGNVEIYLMTRDLIHSEAIKSEANVTIVESTEDYLGGFKAFIKDKNAIADYTFKEKLEEIHRNFNLSNYTELSV